MEHLLTFLFTVTLTLTPPTVAAENTDEDRAFDSPSYLTTAMRLSLPGHVREPSEDEIFGDVEQLGFNSLNSLDFDQNDDFDFELLTKSMKPIYVDDIPADLQFPTEQKRYSEFIGKRVPELLDLPENNDAVKRWSEFVGKRNKSHRLYNKGMNVAKRYMEFLGKRALRSEQAARKRYAEFLG